jgi:anti-sigma factor RsiW
MSCSRRLLSVYLDGELCAEEEEGLLEHLQHCPRCRGELQEMRRLGELLIRWDEGQAPDPMPSDLYLLRLEDRIVAQPEGARKTPADLWKVAGVAAGLAGLVLAGWLAGARIRQDSRDMAAFQDNGWVPLSEVSYLAETPPESFHSIYVNLLVQETAP